MNPNEIVNVLKKYDLASEDTATEEDLLDLVDEDMDSEAMIMEMLNEVAYEKSLFYTMSDSCEEGAIVEGFSANISEIIEIASGKIQISNLKTTPAMNSKGELDDDGEMSISFHWNGADYRWVFRQYDSDIFVEGFTKWVYEALNGDYMFIYDDNPVGYYLPKELIENLESLGLNTHKEYWT